MPSRLLARPFVAALILWIAGLAALFLAVDRLAMPWAAGKFRPMVSVPSVIGMEPASAEGTLRAVGLRFAADTGGDYSRAIPAGRVLAQTPEAGAEVKQGRRVWATLSLGLEPVIHPARGR